jgi:hypothetical protein
MAIADIVTHVRRLVQDEPWADFLSSSYTAGGTTVSTVAPTGWEEGAVMDFPATLQQMRVRSTPTANPITVTISWNNTTNASESNGATIFRDPRFGSDQIDKMITHVVDTRLWPDVWVKGTTTITPSSSTNIYDMPTDYEDFTSSP